MISLIHRKKAGRKGNEKIGIDLFALEEVLFRGGLAALALSSGWFAVMGGIALGTSVVVVVFLLACTYRMYDCF